MRQGPGWIMILNRPLIMTPVYSASNRESTAQGGEPRPCGRSQIELELAATGEAESLSFVKEQGAVELRQRRGRDLKPCPFA